MSSPTRILVTGASGQVGVDLVDTLNGVQPPGSLAAWQPDGRSVEDGEFLVTAFSHRDLDVTDRDAVVTALRSCNADVVVNLAAYTKVDAAERDITSCFALNRDAPVALSELCAERNAHLVTISTDFVFDGLKGSAYLEEDVTNPLNVYGASKREGEIGCSPSDSIVRTSWVLGVRARNVVSIVTERVSHGEPVRFVNDQVGTATFAADLARALVTIVRERPGGLWHFANEGALSWFQLARAVTLIITGSDELATPISTIDLVPHPVALRPIRSDLSTEQWVSRGWSEPSHWSNGLERLLAAR